MDIAVSGSKRPSYRSQAVIAPIEGGFLLIGGTVPSTDNDIWSYDANSTLWTQEPNAALSVEGGCSVQDTDGTIYIYARGDHLYKYSPPSTLTDLHITGDHPTEGVACGIRNGTIYLFGGQSGGRCHIKISMYNTKDSTATKWTPVEVKDPTVAPSPRSGASGLVFGDSFVLWGGSCQSDDPNVWTFDLVGKSWTTDSSTSVHKPSTRSYQSAAVDELAPSNSFVIFGGEDYNTHELLNDIWVYNLKNMTWAELTPTMDGKAYPEPRENAAFVYSGGRFFLFSGAGINNASIPDFWQLVITEDCYHRIDCDECVNTVGCGWCSTNEYGFECVPGTNKAPFVDANCHKGDFDSDLTICPADAFPGWIVALIIVASILVIGVVWYLVIRCQKKSGGYEQIN